MNGKTMMGLMGLMLAAAVGAADTNTNWTVPVRRPDFSLIYTMPNGVKGTQQVWKVGGWIHSRTAGPDWSLNFDKPITATNAPPKK